MSSEAITLRVRFVGDVDGLSEHRLSVARFSEPLQRLLAAYRGSASAVLRGDDSTETASKFHVGARHLDLQIASISGDCVDLGFHPAASASEQPALIDGGLSADFEMKAAQQLLDDLEHGRGRAGVFLSRLPRGLRTHRYSIAVGGVEVRAVERVGDEENSAVAERVPPRLRSGVGVVVGVGFAPTPSVRIRLDVGGTTSFTATDRLVDAAFALRGQTAVAIRYVDTGEERRLLTLHGQGQQPTMNADQRKAHIVSRWRNVLVRLGE